MKRLHSSYLLFPFFFLFFYSFSISSSFAAKVYGQVRDASGNPLAFVNVVVEGTTRGTTTNTEGNYELALPDGSYRLVFQYIGYQKQYFTVNLEGGNRQLDVVMQESTLELATITVRPNGEDPAYEIIRQAQNKRRYYLEKEFEGYQCQLYTKIFEESKRSGGTINLFGARRQIEPGIFYLSETLSELSFQQKNRRLEKIKASKVSGDTSNYSYNQGVYLNFYGNYSLRMNQRFIISPIAEQALKHYEYKLEGVKKENGQNIYKIRLLPKYKSAPVFTGFIYILDESWRIHSIDAHIAPEVVPAFDSTSVRQIYVPLGEEKEVWLPFSLTFYFQLFQGQVKGYYHVISSDYDLNPAFPDDFFSNQVLQYLPGATEKQDDFWQETRPIPLTQAERKEYGEALALEEEEEVVTLPEDSELPEDLDFGEEEKEEAKRPRFNWGNFIFGGAGIRVGKEGRIGFKPLFELASFNTVEGLVFDYWLRYDQKFSQGRNLRLQPFFRYGVSNERFQSKLEAQYSWSRKPGFVRLAGGRYVEQIAGFTAIDPRFNLIYTLFSENNYLKLYEKNFADFAFRQEWFNGFRTDLKLEYARRRPMFNNSDYTLVDEEEREYTPNQPFNVEVPSTLFEEHDALILEAGIRYAVRQEYVQRPDGKEITTVRGPTFSLNYRKGLSDVDYDFLQGRISDRFRLGVLGRTELLAEGGLFVNDDSLTFLDFHHFAGNKILLLQEALPGSFQLLDYYTYATRDRYVQAHWLHHFDGLLLGLIPGIRNLNWNLVIGANYLSTPELENYVELGVGVEKIFGLLRLDWYHSLNRENNSVHGFRLRLGR